MNITTTLRHHVNCSWMLLKVTYGLFFIILGADKFFNMITDWQKFVNPMITEKLAAASIDLSQFMMGVGVLEIIIGLLILFGLTRIGAYLAAVVAFVGAASMLSMGTISTSNLALMVGPFGDIALRDIVIGVGALVLAYLTTIHEEVYSKKGDGARR